VSAVQDVVAGVAEQEVVVVLAEDRVVVVAAVQAVLAPAAVDRVVAALAVGDVVAGAHVDVIGRRSADVLICECISRVVRHVALPMCRHEANRLGQ
jgi:hypothetical protein